MDTQKEILQEKKSSGGKNFNVYKPLYFKDKHQIWNVAAPRFTCVCVRYKLSHPQAFEEEATGGKPGNIKVTALACWGRWKARGSVNRALCAEATASGLPATQRAPLINFCFSFGNMPVDGRVLSMSLYPSSLAMNHYLSHDCQVTGWCWTRRKYTVDIFS